MALKLKNFSKKSSKLSWKQLIYIIILDTTLSFRFMLIRLYPYIDYMYNKIIFGPKTFKARK